MSRRHFLLDTNILSEPLRPQPNPQVMTLLARYSGQTSTATLVYHEMLYGCYRLPPDSRKRQVIEAYLKQEVELKLPLLPYGTEAAKWHALERARLVQAGQTPTFVDAQIAAIAIVNDRILVTRNLADYANFADLKTVDWFSLG